MPGDKNTLRRALKLPPGHASPLDTDLAGPALYAHETCWAMSRPDALEIRQEILAAMKHRRQGELKAGAARQAANRIAPRQKSKGLLDISNPSKRRSTDHEIVAPLSGNMVEPTGVSMTKLGPREKLYPVIKIAMIVDALKGEGVSSKEALAGIDISEAQLCSPAVRVSANQIIQSYCNAIRLSRNLHFAYHTGLRFHVSAYGMYGFAMLSGTDFRRTMAFVVEYHQLAAPLVDVQFLELDKVAVWTMTPFPFSQLGVSLYRFIVELQAGVHISLHRDFMGQSFCASELQFAFGRPRGSDKDAEVFGCPVRYGQPENKLFFDVGWLNGTPNLGNEVTYSELLQLCDKLLRELKLNTGMAGKVREIFLSCLGRPTSFEKIAARLEMSPRSLRRKLEQEGTSFRELIDELRAHAAIKYVRDTDLTVEDIAYALGFSDAAAFRHAFRRWTKSAPHEYRRARFDIDVVRPLQRKAPS